MMSRNNRSPQLQPYFDDQQPDSEDELELFDFGETSNNRFGSAQNEEDDDLKNYETFYCADPLISDNDGMMMLSEQTRMLDLGDLGRDDKDFDWPDPSTIPLPSAFLNTDRSSEFAAWIENTDLKPSTSMFGGNDLFSFGGDSTKSQERAYKFDEDSYRKMSKHWETPTDTKDSEFDILLNILAQNNQHQIERPPEKPKVWTEEMLLKQDKEEEEKQRLLDILKSLGCPAESGQIAQPDFNYNTDLIKRLQRADCEQSNQKAWNKMPPQSTIPSQQAPNFYEFVRPPCYGQLPALNQHQNHGRHNIGNRPNTHQQYLQHSYNRPPPPPGMMIPPINGMSPTVMNLMSTHSCQRNTLPPGMPPCGAPPGFSNGYPPFPSFVSNMLAQQRLLMSGSARGSNSSLCSNRTRKPFLPSTKTLSDFAFDPYAGLMSKKEREWMIKIQLIQCTVTGDPFEDDYYYSVWKERNVLAKVPVEWKVSIQPKYYNFDNTYPSDRYIAPVFSGSLGRPTHATTSFPRQIIDLQSDSFDDDTESSAGKSISQKKLRAILMRIENASISLLECRDVLYKASKTEQSEFESQRVVPVVTEKIQAIIKCVARQELPTVMLIQKGRYLIGQLITHSDDSQASEIMTTLVENTPRFAHRIPSESNNQPLLRAIISKLRNMDLYVFKLLKETLPIHIIEPLLGISPFVQQLCLALMIGLCGRESHSSDLVRGPIGSWLADNDVERFQALLSVFNQNAFDFDLLQLSRGLSLFPPNSIGSKLSEVLKSKIKMRPTKNV